MIRNFRIPYYHRYVSFIILFMPLTLSPYSHGSFFVTGKVSHVTFADLAHEMKAIWDEVKTSNYPANIRDPEHGSLHAVYFNHSDTGFDMLIGLITKSGSVQTESGLTTIEIPAQDYQYAEFDFTGPESVSLAWQAINGVSREELPRKFGYDLEMYGEDMKKFTIALSV